MPKFVYEATDSRGKTVSGIVNAQSKEQVLRDLRSQKYNVKSIKEQGGGALEDAGSITARFQHVSVFSLAIFTRQFAVLFNSGMSMVRSLEALMIGGDSEKLTRTIEQIAKDIKAGYSLSRALSKHPDVFSPVYISLVKAGEMAGALGEVLDRLASLMERDNALRKKVSSAMTYPIFVLFFACVVVIGLVLYILPQFMDIFTGLGTELPIYTKILMWIVNTALNPAFIVCFVLFVSIIWISSSFYLKTPQGRKFRDTVILELPIIGPINKKTVIARFCRTLGTLISSGVPVVHSLEIVARAVGNERVSDLLSNVKEGLKAGLRLSQPMMESNIFPPIVSNMVAIGEETGSLAMLMEKLANYFDQEVEYALSSFASVIEPIMILGLGGIIGFILLAVFMPIYGLVSNF